MSAEASALQPPAPLTALAARAGIRAGAMGLLPEGSEIAVEDPKQAESLVARLLKAARRAGIGRSLVPPAEGEDRERWVDLTRTLLGALAESPQPKTEWAGTERTLGADLLAELIGISPSSLRRYAAGARATPDDVAARLHFVALVVGDLSGSYNEIGVRRWFRRRRTQLDGRSPAELLGDAWDPEDQGPERVRSLAASLLDSSAT